MNPRKQHWREAREKNREKLRLGLLYAYARKDQFPVSLWHSILQGRMPI